jgi:glyoxylase-like metal-dependent hydrolase (beta-lactamase superfamily II)
LLDGIEEIKPAQVVFENAPPDELGAGLSCQGTSAASGFLATWTCLLITTEQHKVLVDTGMGRIEPTGGHLVEALRQAGAEPRDIDLVILSHGHGDHIAGNTQADGSLAFPNAEWVIDREEWKFWLQSPHPPSVPDFFGEIAREQLQPIANCVTLVDRAKEIVPGVSLVPLHGHTPGHMAVAVCSGRYELLYTADALLHPLHVEHPEWCAATWADMDWEQVTLSRRYICDRAAAEDALVLSYHFHPFPSLGRIRHSGRTWQWEPIAT